MLDDIVDGKQGRWDSGKWHPNKVYLVYYRYHCKHRVEFDTIQEAYNYGKMSEDYGEIAIKGIDYDDVLYECSPIMGKYSKDNEVLRDKFGIDLEPYDDD